MRSFWSDPYLWIHLAGLAALPLWLELCFLGLAVGDPIFPVWLELALVAIAGIAPILWMQWQRPFYIFSLVAISLKPENLTLPQRQLLTRFKSIQNRLLAVVVSILLAIALRQLYVLAPIGTAAVPFSIESRALGLIIAAISFLGSNLFLQVPVSVASVMLTSDSAFTSTEPYLLEKIAQDFTQLGLPVSQLLPEVVSLKDSAIASPIVPSPVQSESAVEAGDFWEDDLVPPPEEVISASPLGSVVTEEEESNATTSEAEDSALEELIVEKEEAEKEEVEKEEVEIETETIVEVVASDISVEVAEPAVTEASTESDSEVEHEPAEDLDAIATIDEQSSTDLSSTEEPDPSTSDPLI